MVDCNFIYMTRPEIIKKIEELFYAKSFKEVSMQNIANEIGMKKASLYYHFPSKEVLIREVLEESFENYLSFIKKIIEKWNEHNFQELLKKFLDFPEKNKNIFSIINQNGYEENDEISQIIEEKQKIIFETIFTAMNTKAWFSREKVFLFFALIQQMGKKKSTYSRCKIEKTKLLCELESLFFNTPSSWKK